MFLYCYPCRAQRRRRDMVSFNRAVLAGNLTRDPELRFTNDGIPVCSLGLAVNRVRSKSEEVDFFDVSAWRELGQTIANYKKKGDPILVEGRLHYRTWEAEDGSKRRKLGVLWAAAPERGAAAGAARPGPPLCSELPRTPLPRTRVNRGKKTGQ